MKKKYQICKKIIFNYLLKVEGQIVNILRSRLDDCIFYEKGSGPAQWGDPRDGPTVDVSEGSNHPCRKILETFER